MDRGFYTARGIQTSRARTTASRHCHLHHQEAEWALVLAQHAKRDDVVFADLVSGRAGVDPSVADAVGCCSTPMPVRVRLDPSSTYADLVYAVQKQQLDSIPFETFGFSRIAQH